MLFNIVLVIFLIISFLITFAAIGNCLIRLRALSECVDNIHKVQSGMFEVMKVSAEYDDKQLAIVEQLAHHFDALENSINTAVRELHLAIFDYNKIMAEYAIKPEDTTAEPSKPARKSAKKVTK